jgi:alkyl hydroperoxide reductase subunit AhpF
MSLLSESDREQLRKQFEQMQNPVKLLFFFQNQNRPYSSMARQVLEEATSLSSKIQLRPRNYDVDKDEVEKYKIKRVPAVAVLRMETQQVGGKTETVDRDYGIRFYGVPGGYEFYALLGDILDVSNGESGLSQDSKTALANLKDPMHLQVFTAPT